MLRSRFLAISSKIVINTTSKANTVVIFESLENDFKVTHTKNVAPMLVSIGPKVILGWRCPALPIIIFSPAQTQIKTVNTFPQSAKAQHIAAETIRKTVFAYPLGFRGSLPYALGSLASPSMGPWVPQGPSHGILWVPSGRAKHV